MFRRARELGPPMLVPLAWTFVTAAHLDVVSDHTLLVAQVVMGVLLAGFAITGRADMRTGILDVWWRIIAVGFFVTVAGVVGFLVESGVLLAVAIGGWMLLPAIGFVATGQRVEEGAWIYVGGTLGCLGGALLYAIGLFVAGPPAQVLGLVLVGGGQTAGILDATLRY